MTYQQIRNITWPDLVFLRWREYEKWWIFKILQIKFYNFRWQILLQLRFVITPALGNKIFFRMKERNEKWAKIWKIYAMVRQVIFHSYPNTTHVGKIFEESVRIHWFLEWFWGCLLKLYLRATKHYTLFSGQYIGQPGVGNYQDKEDPIEYVDTKSNQRNYQIHDHHLNERQTFRASTYANDMMAGFKSLKDSRSLCDCILVAQNVQFHVHKELALIYQTETWTKLFGFDQNLNRKSQFSLPFPIIFEPCSALECANPLQILFHYR